MGVRVLFRDKAHGDQGGRHRDAGRLHGGFWRVMLVALCGFWLVRTLKLIDGAGVGKVIPRPRG